MLPLFFFFTFSSMFAFFSTPLWNHSHLNSYSAWNKTQLTHTHTHTVNTARHSAELWFQRSAYSYCFHLLRRWLSNELENTKQSHAEVLGYKQLPAVSIRSEAQDTHPSCTQMQVCRHTLIFLNGQKHHAKVHSQIGSLRRKKEEKTYFTVLPDAGDLLRRDWTTVLGEPRFREPDIFP